MENQDKQMYVPLSKTRIKMGKFHRNWTNTMLKLKKEQIIELGECWTAKPNIIKVNEIHEEEEKSYTRHMIMIKDTTEHTCDACHKTFRKI